MEKVIKITSIDEEFENLNKARVKSFFRTRKGKMERVKGFERKGLERKIPIGSRAIHRQLREKREETEKNREKNIAILRDQFDNVDSRSAAEMLEGLGMKNATKKWSDENWGDEELKANFDRQIKRMSSRNIAGIVEYLGGDEN